MPVTSAQVWTFLWLHVGTILVVTAYFAVATAIAPGIVGRGADRFGRRPWLAMLVGVLCSLPWALASLALMQIGRPPFIGVGQILGLSWLLAGLVGAASIALHVGRREGDHSPTTETVRGGLLLTLTWALPVIGWFIVLPLTLATGVGCLVLGVLPRKSAPSMRSQPRDFVAARPDAALGLSHPAREDV